MINGPIHETFLHIVPNDFRLTIFSLKAYNGPCLSVEYGVFLKETKSATILRRKSLVSIYVFS